MFQCIKSHPRLFTALFLTPLLYYFLYCQLGWILEARSQSDQSWWLYLFAKKSLVIKILIAGIAAGAISSVSVCLLFNLFPNWEYLRKHSLSFGICWLFPFSLLSFIGFAFSGGLEVWSSLIGMAFMGVLGGCVGLVVFVLTQLPVSAVNQGVRVSNLQPADVAVKNESIARAPTIQKLSRAQLISIIIIAGIPITFSSYFWFYINSQIAKGNASSNFLSTQGTIIYSHTEMKGEGMLISSVKYQYIVNGRTYAGKTVGYPDDVTDSKQVLMFPQGKKVAVYFDSNNPASSCLERGIKVEVMKPALYFASILFALGVLVGLILFVCVRLYNQSTSR